MRGTVLKYDDTEGAGYISGDDGTRYTFTRADLQQLQPISTGTKVDFDTEGKQAREIYVLSTFSNPQTPTFTGEVEPELGVFEYFKRAVTQKYSTFHGRARRKEYWSFQLFYLILLLIGIFVMIGLVAGMSASGGNLDLVTSLLPLFLLIVILSVIVPSIALSVRRLHDFGQSGWWFLGVFLISLIPVLSWIGIIAYIVIGVIDSQPQENKYGPPVKKAG